MKLVEFIIASSLLTLIPGPDILFVLTQSILHGKRAGISVALGLCSGLFFHTAAAALGLSLIIASSPALFAGIKYAGICYLLWMGYASLRAYRKTARGKVPSPGNIAIEQPQPFPAACAGQTETITTDPAASGIAPAPDGAPQTPENNSFRRLYRIGITMNLLNPKVILFFLAFFPQFISRESLTPKTDTLLLGLTFAAVAVVIFTTVALVADYLAAKFSIEQIPPRILGLDPGSGLLADRRAVRLLLRVAPSTFYSTTYRI